MINTLIVLEQDLHKFKGKSHLALADWTALVNPRFLPVFIFRISSMLWSWKLGGLSKLVALANQILFGCDIARGTRIGGGLYMPHPNGIVVGEYVVIGRNCIIHQGVTLGARGEDHELANPRIGDEVEIGTGAKVLGKVQIGDYARIGANAVVLKDIPRLGIAVGIPAKVLGFREDLQQNQ